MAVACFWTLESSRESTGLHPLLQLIVLLTVSSMSLLPNVLLACLPACLLQLHYLTVANYQDIPVLAACHVLCRLTCVPITTDICKLFCCIPCSRLADALDSGVTSPATRHAIEALHALATHLPTSRDLILATGAVAKLVDLLRDSCAQAHYSMLKVISFA